MKNIIECRLFGAILEWKWILGGGGGGIHMYLENVCAYTTFHNWFDNLWWWSFYKYFWIFPKTYTLDDYKYCQQHKTEIFHIPARVFHMHRTNLSLSHDLSETLYFLHKLPTLVAGWVWANMDVILFGIFCYFCTNLSQAILFLMR